MRKTFLRFRFLLLAAPIVFGLVAGACDDNNDNPTSSTAAPREPTATPTPSAVPTAPPTASPTPGAGSSVGFLGRINTMNGGTLGIGAFDVIVNGSTRYFRNGQDSDLSAFSIGEDVRVAGTEQDSHTVVAAKISLLPDVAPTPTPQPTP
jgi:hypothetical protein